MDKYTIDLKTLFEAFRESPEDDLVYLECDCYIERDAHDGKEYFDLKNPFGIPCMDGETCLVTHESNGYVYLEEESEGLPFRLSKRNFDIATGKESAA